MGTTLKWIIDFGEMTENEASLYEAPFEYVVQHVKPERLANRDTQRREKWWRLGRSGGDLNPYSAGQSFQRHPVFSTWTMPLITLRSSTRRAPGWFFGAFEEDSSGIDNTPNTTFDTFPFPDGMSPKVTSLGVV